MRLLAVTLTLASLAGSLALANAAPGRPNIIFLLTDDQRDNTFGVMGHKWVKTPHLDALINGGVRFSNAYIAEPTCAPSRVALFTGMHERVNGVGFTSSYELTEEQWAKSYPALLRKSGYHTGFVGKFGVQYYTFRGQTAEKFDYWRGHDGWAKFFPSTAKNCEAYFDSEEEIITPVMGESIARFLDDAPDGAPFCLSVSFSIPHGSQTGSMHTTWEEPASRNPRLEGHPIYGGLYRDLEIRIPAETGTDPYMFIPRTVMDQDRGRRNKTYSYSYDLDTCRELHIRYYQQITGLDLVIGEMMEQLEREGRAGNTIILFGSDHGLLMGEYGMGGKGLLYDLTSKFPCFVYDPRLPEDQRGRTVEALVSSLDIPSTILDYAGVPQPSEMEGRSLVPLVNGDDVEWRKALFLENLYTGRDTPFSEGLRKGNWKYIRMFDGVAPYSEQHVNFAERQPDFEQLFDLENDPGEKTNLVERLEGAPILADLRELCRQRSVALNNLRSDYRKTHTVSKRAQP